MGVQEATKYGAIGFLADRLLNTGWLGTLAGAAYGGLFSPDPGEMSDVYDKRKATVGQTLKDFFGYDMTDGLFGTAAKDGKKAEDLGPSRVRAEEKAEAKEKSDGIPWGKVLLAGGAALLGVSILDNVVLNGFSNPLFAPFVPPIGPWGGAWGGVNPMFNPLASILGLDPFGILF